MRERILYEPLGQNLGGTKSLQTALETPTAGGAYMTRLPRWWGVGRLCLPKIYRFRGGGVWGGLPPQDLPFPAGWGGRAAPASGKIIVLRNDELKRKQAMI